MEWTIYNVLCLLNETLQLEIINIIIKVKTCSFEKCIICPQKCHWTKLQGNDQNFMIIPRNMYLYVQ